MESPDAQVREFESDNYVFYQLKQAWSGYGGKCLSLGSSAVYILCQCATAFIILGGERF